MLVKMLKSFGKNYAEGKTYEIDCDDTVKSLIDNGFAEEIKSETIVSDIKSAFEELKTELKGEILAEVKDAVKSTSFKLPAEPKEPESLSEFVKAVSTKDHNLLTKKYGSKLVTENNLTEVKGSTMVEGTGNLGGYLVPRTLQSQILSAPGYTPVLYPRVLHVPMTTSRIDFPADDQSGTPSGGSSAFHAGVATYWTAEGANATKTNYTPAQIALQAKKLTAYCQVSEELFADSIASIDTILRSKLGKACLQTAEYAICVGDGIDKPLGICESGAAISVTRATASHFKPADAATMLSRSLEGSSPVWVMSPSVLADLIQFQDEAGQFCWVQNGNVAGGIQAMLMGKPVLISENLPALASAKSVMLVDPSYYLVGDRQEMIISVSEHVGFVEGTVALKIVMRLDGQPTMNNPIKTAGDTSFTVSPYVYLT